MFLVRSLHLSRDGQSQRQGHLAIIPPKFPSLCVTDRPWVVTIVCTSIRPSIAVWLHQNESEYSTELFR